MLKAFAYHSLLYVPSFMLKSISSNAGSLVLNVNCIREEDGKMKTSFSFCE